MSMNATELVSVLKGNLSRVIRGKDGVIDYLLVAMLCNGHVLIEDVPGVGKTTLAKALARSIRGVFRRIQFTPDLLPTDIVGGMIYSPKTGDFSFRPGPVFCNVLLSDLSSCSTTATTVCLALCLCTCSRSSCSLP